MYLRDEHGPSRIFEREDRHGVARGTWIVSVGRVQEWRRVGVAVTAAVLATVASVLFECRSEHQLGGDAIAEGFAWLELESRRRTKERIRSWKWREVVCEEVAGEFTDGVQDVIYGCGRITTISTSSKRRRDIGKR